MKPYTYVIHFQELQFKNQNTLMASFDLKGRSRGAWDVVVSVPGEPAVTLANGFTIEEGQSSQPWLYMIGRNSYRVDRPYSFRIYYGNTGNIDAHGVPLFITGIPPDATVRFGFKLAELPDKAPNGDPIDLSWIPAVLSSKDGTQQMIPLLLANIPAGYSGLLEFTLDIPRATASDFALKAFLLKPWFGSPISYDAVQCIVSAVSMACTSIPVLDCVMATFSAGLAIGDIFISGPHFDTIVPAAGAVGIVAMQCADEAGWIGSETVFDPLTIIGSGLVDTAECGKGLFDYMNVEAVYSWDPNAKSGPQGFGDMGYVTANTPMPFGVFFENLDTATAPAQEVLITDQLDTANLDLSTFSLGPISFGATTVVPPPGLSSYLTEVT